MMKSFFKNNNGSTLMLMSVLMLGAILMVSLSASDVIKNSLELSKLQIDATESYFTAEGGLERILWQVRQNDFDVGSCDDGDYLSFLAAKCAPGSAPCCVVGEVIHDVSGNNKYTMLFEKAGSDVVFTSFGLTDESQRVVEINYCLVDCENKGCGDGNGCGGSCPPSCNADPGCRSIGTVNNVTEIEGGGCCAGDLCYECANGHEWNGVECELMCSPDCELKNCGDVDGCGSICPATCTSIPGCRLAAVSGAGVVTGTCCGGETCYECNVDHVWDEDTQVCVMFGQIISNSATGKNCDTICAENYPGSDCVSIGTDDFAINGELQIYDIVNYREVCDTTNGDCATVFGSAPVPYRPFFCSGKQTNWTNCRCFTCVDEEGDPCVVTDDCLQDGFVSCDGTCVSDGPEALGFPCEGEGACDGNGTCAGCHDDYTLECGEDLCVNPGAYDCIGACAGTSSRMYGFDCGEGMECNADGGCAPIVREIDVLNNRTGESCASICASNYLNRPCRDVGTNSIGANNRQESATKDWKSGVYTWTNKYANCFSVMWPHDDAGYRTNCSCDRCVAEYNQWCPVDDGCTQTFGKYDCNGNCVGAVQRAAGYSCDSDTGECDGAGVCDACLSNYGLACNTLNDCLVEGTIDCDNNCTKGVTDFKDAGESCASDLGECDGAGTCDICDAGYTDGCDGDFCVNEGVISCLNGCVGASNMAQYTSCQTVNECNDSGDCLPPVDVAVLLNSRTSLSCDQMCAAINGRDCTSQGTDLVGINNFYYTAALNIMNWTLKCILNVSADTSVIMNAGFLLSCGGYDATWANCVCEHCVGNFNDQCHDAECEVAGTRDCDGVCDSIVDKSLGTPCDEGAGIGECDGNGNCDVCEADFGDQCNNLSNDCLEQGEISCLGSVCDKTASDFMSLGSPCLNGAAVGECDGVGACVTCLGDYPNACKTFPCSNDGNVICDGTCDSVGYVTAGETCNDGADECQADNTCKTCTGNFGDPCGALDCVYAGIYDCDGNCQGATNKAIGTNCGTGDECDGAGSCEEPTIDKIILNVRTNMSCDALCSGVNGRTCTDVGTDVAATNNTSGYRAFNNCYYDYSTSCSDAMTIGSDSVLCNGYGTKWTRCLCKACDDDYPNACNTANDCLVSGTTLCNGACTTGATDYRSDGYPCNSGAGECDGVGTCDPCTTTPRAACGELDCVYPGTLSCDGLTCSGTSNKLITTDCGGGEECNGAGSCEEPVTPIIGLNSATGESCNQFCASNYIGRDCTAMGLDGSDSIYARDTDVVSVGSRSTVMGYSGNYYSGIMAYWTRCTCELCDGSYDSACNNEDCHEEGIFDCEGNCSTGTQVSPLDTPCGDGTDECDAVGNCDPCGDNHDGSCNDDQCQIEGIEDCEENCSSDAVRAYGFTCDFSGDEGRCGNGTGTCIPCDGTNDTACNNDDICKIESVFNCMGVCESDATYPDDSWCEWTTGDDESGTCQAGVCVPCSDLKYNLCYEGGDDFTGDATCLEPGLVDCAGNCPGVTQKPEGGGCGNQMECTADGKCEPAPLVRIVKNEATGRTCNDICTNDANGRDCLGVGVNAGASDTDGWYLSIFNGVNSCVKSITDCTVEIQEYIPNGESEFLCSGGQTAWTNCLCSH